MTTRLRAAGAQGQSWDFETEHELARQETVDAVLKLLQVGLNVTSRLVTPKLQIPGIGTGAAYAAGDAFGTSFSFPFPRFGTINNLLFYDLDDEGLPKELVLFNAPFTETADNSAFAVSDANLEACVGIVRVDTFYNFANNQVGMGTPALSIEAPQERLWGQWVTRGVDNIAAGAIPSFRLVVE